MKQYVLGLGLVGAITTSCFGPSRESMLVADEYTTNSHGEKEATFLEKYRAGASLEYRVMCLAGVHANMLKMKQNADGTFRYEGAFRLVPSIDPLKNALREILAVLDADKDHSITSAELLSGEQEMYSFLQNQKDAALALHLQFHGYDATNTQRNQLVVLAGVLSGTVKVNKKSPQRFAFDGDFNPVLHPQVIPFLLKKVDTNHDRLITDTEVSVVAQELFFQAEEKQ
ncbi:MAG: hypothetical protein AABW64_02820 [Nanoarchaeota archaeon]